MNKNVRIALALPLAIVMAVARADEPGAVQWIAQTPGEATLQHLTVGPDGTIYTSDREQTYAFSPAGELLWTNTQVHGGRPISLDADGDIYIGAGTAVSGDGRVFALNPDGTTKWIFTPPAQGGLIAGPGVGPDGNIFAVQDTQFGGLGAFALDPDGNLLWSNEGDLPIHASAGDNGPVVFNKDRFHFGVVTFPAGSNPVIYTFDLDGDQLWTTWPLQPTSGSSDPCVDPFGRVIGLWGQVGIRAFDENGQEAWVSVHPAGQGQISLLMRPVIDAITGVIYTADLFGLQLWAINPDGTTRWFNPPTGEIIADNMGLSPNGQVIVLSGIDVPGEPGWVRGYAATDGALLWQVDLPAEQDLNPFVSSFEPVFSADSSTVYITTQFPGDGVGHGYLYAITIGEPARMPGDITGDGDVDFDDFSELLASWGEPGCGGSLPCNADLDNDGDVDFDDFTTLLANWS